MSVSFTPGPHPDAPSRTTSSLRIDPSSSNLPDALQSAGASITTTPLTTSPLSTNFPRRYASRPEDPERQPLISASELGRPGRFWPITVGILATLVVGLMIGLGGWMLSRGEGGARWPGGPS